MTRLQTSGLSVEVACKGNVHGHLAAEDAREGAPLGCTVEAGAGRTGVDAAADRSRTQSECAFRARGEANEVTLRRTTAAPGALPHGDACGAGVAPTPATVT